MNEQSDCNIDVTVIKKQLKFFVYKFNKYKKNDKKKESFMKLIIQFRNTLINIEKFKQKKIVNRNQIYKYKKKYYGEKPSKKQIQNYNNFLKL